MFLLQGLILLCFLNFSFRLCILRERNESLLNKLRILSEENKDLKEKVSKK